MSPSKPKRKFIDALHEQLRARVAEREPNDAIARLIREYTNPLIEQGRFTELMRIGEKIHKAGEDFGDEVTHALGEGTMIIGAMGANAIGTDLQHAVRYVDYCIDTMTSGERDILADYLAETVTKLFQRPDYQLNAITGGDIQTFFARAGNKALTQRGKESAKLAQIAGTIAGEVIPQLELPQAKRKIGLTTSSTGLLETRRAAIVLGPGREAAEGALPSDAKGVIAL